MPISVVLGIQDPTTAGAVQDLLRGENDVDVRGNATSADMLLALALDHEPDAILLHEGFGPAPALSIARDLIDRLPWMSVVLLAREPTLDLSQLATDAGVRSIVGWPVSFTDLSARLTAAARLSRGIRSGSQARSDSEEPGRMVTLVGAKGGVGTTTLATQLSFLAGGVEGRRACLVDLDFLGGDMAGYVGCGATRSILDLRDVSDELSPAVLQPLLFAHESGVRMLFAPEDIVDGELVSESLVRRTLGVLRTMFDVVIVDVGSRLRETALPAVELADRVVVVVTPDLTALRHGHRLVEGWESLDIARDSVEMVLNKVNRSASVQPQLVGRVSSLPLCRTTVPEAPGAMERLANEGAAGLRNQRGVSRSLEQLAVHLGIRPSRRSWFAPLWRRRGDDKQRPGAEADPGRESPAPDPTPEPGSASAGRHEAPVAGDRA